MYNAMNLPEEMMSIMDKYIKEMSPICQKFHREIKKKYPDACPIITGALLRNYCISMADYDAQVREALRSPRKK